MNHRSCQIYMTHSLATNSTVGDLDTAAVADYSLELRALIFAAGAFPVSLGPEDSLAEQAVLLRTIRTIVNRLGLAHLAK